MESDVSPDKYLPHIDRRRCTLCGRCLEACPTQALEETAETVVLAHPESCTLCTICELSCPHNAISLPFMVVFAPSQRTPHLQAPRRHPKSHPSKGGSQ